VWLTQKQDGDFLSLRPTTVCRRIDPAPEFWTRTSMLPPVEQGGVGQTDPREVVSGAQQETLQKDFQATTRRMSEILLASDIYLAPYVANTKPEVK
jgi:hypothetical protein